MSLNLTGHTLGFSSSRRVTIKPALSCDHMTQPPFSSGIGWPATHLLPPFPSLASLLPSLTLPLHPSPTSSTSSLTCISWLLVAQHPFNKLTFSRLVLSSSSPSFAHISLCCFILFDFIWFLDLITHDVLFIFSH